MRERAQLVGGGFSIAGAAGSGTTVRVRIPWRHKANV
jgi:signal transduction histidine kinase